jgi:hypothetical protein
MGGWETLVEATDQQGANEDETSKDASERVHAVSVQSVIWRKKQIFTSGPNVPQNGDSGAESRPNSVNSITWPARWPFGV